ncbi:hypothetical protein M8J77_015738 [Diaphorina citri]|nr:hypothetical protein M8J77_015738 [Diaphorina citri]
MNIATEFYKDLYTRQNRDEIDTALNRNEDNNTFQLPPILDSEVHKAIKELKNGKCPGSDGITNEILKTVSEEISEPLSKIFSNIMKTTVIPNDWNISEIVLLHKKGPKDNIANYRPISLMSVIYKLFTKIILNRIKNILDENQPPDQAGFRAGYSTMDHLFVVNQVIEKYNEYNKKLYIAFIDFNKAFDMVEHKSLMNALHQQGVPKPYIDILEKIYDSSIGKIRLEKVGPPFRLERGVRQGDPISPKLFTALLEQVFRNIDWDEHMGININGKTLSNLRFADDIALFAENHEDIQRMLQHLSKESEKVGLKINESKTKIMTNNTREETKLNDKIIEYVEDYCYLGQTVSFLKHQDKEIKIRIGNAWKQYWSLSFILKGDFSMKIKRDVMNMCILPVLTYGTETLALTKEQTRKLKVCQRRMERSILGISLRDRIRNTEIRRRTGVKDVGEEVWMKKWQWAGHVARMNPEKWTKLCYEWYPRDRVRRAGRPTTRWRDSLHKAVGPLWTHEAQNREHWKFLGEALAPDGDVVG